MEKSSDKAAVNSIKTNSTVMQRKKRLHKNKAGRTNKKNLKLLEKSVKERKIHQPTVLQSTSGLAVLLDCKLKAHS